MIYVMEIVEDENLWRFYRDFFFVECKSTEKFTKTYLNSLGKYS